MRWTLIGLAVLLSGCLNWRGPNRRPTPDELRGRDEMIGAWERAGRPSPWQHELCEQLDRLVIVLVREPPNGRSPCHNWTGDTYYPTCVLGVNPSVFEPVHMAVYIDTDRLQPDEYPNAVAHETGHVLKGCIDRNPDRSHIDHELWGPILEDALRRLTLPRLQSTW